jgi:hypothetical protein
MTRSIFAAIAVIAAALAVAVGYGAGCKQTGVGDPCVPEQEYKHWFLDFSQDEVDVESKSFQCQTRLCLVNHFQGRVSCPYGQTDAGAGPVNAQGQSFDPCFVPGTHPQKCPDNATPNDGCIDGKDDTGNPTDPKRGAQVQPQCTDRTADKTVYCSCRCANVNGRTDDGAIYCTCPDGFACEQLVSSIGTANEGLTGAYCIKNGTKFDPNSHCPETCDVNGGGNCGTLQGVH